MGERIGPVVGDHCLESEGRRFPPWHPFIPFMHPHSRVDWYAKLDENLQIVRNETPDRQEPAVSQEDDQIHERGLVGSAVV